MRLYVPCRWVAIKRFLTLAVLIYVTYLFYDIYTRAVEMQFYSLHMIDIGDNASGFECMIPDYNPLDPSITKYIEKVKPINCGENQPYLTFLDSEGYIHMNKTAIQQSGYDESDYDCSYSDIIRPDGNDGEVTFSHPQVFRGSEKIGSQAFILVRCYLRTTKELIYENLHFYIPLPTGKLQKTSRRSQNGDIDSPSVLIVTVDSMSRLNFMRQLPRTYRALTQILNATVFKGMAKTGDNTFPNMIPFLTGKRLERASYYDDFPLAWKNYSDKGYATMFNEDFPYLSLFNYLASGFKNPPTDYYTHPFWLAVENVDNFESGDWRCFSNTPKHIYFLDYVKQFAARMNDYRYFALSFITGLSHVDLNLIQVGDADFEAAFLEMWNKGHLNNTVLIVLGDHGNRFSGLRQTLIGRVESNMPFLAVRLPDVFKNKYPHLQLGLQSNSNRLLSWFDFYELLMDLCNKNLGEKYMVKRYGTFGSSPFREISNRRTCNDAGIPQEYCICTREIQLSTKNTRVKAISHDLLFHINSVLLADSVRRGLCVPLVLTDILNAQLLSLGSEVVKPRSFKALYRVTIKVSPSDGVFEGTLELDAWSNHGRVVGDVNRLNLYGTQSECVHDNILRLYCFCSALIKTI